MRSSRLLMSLLLVGLALVFQNCTPVQFDNFTSLSVATPKMGLNGNGGVYEGKLRILHHYVDNFKCEGRAQPESILIRINDDDWQLISNTVGKCAAVDQVAVTRVVYDDNSKQAQFEGKTYIAPKPYSVDASEDPNLPDVKLNDGVCEDKNGKCSLLAAVQQAGAASSTDGVLVEVPAATYALNTSILLRMSVNGHPVTIRGRDGINTIIDGQNITSLFSITGNSGLASFENLTFQNGNSANGWGIGSIAEAMALSPVSFFGDLNVRHCLFKNNKDNRFSPTIYGGPGTGNISIQKSQFVNNQNSAIQVFHPKSLLVEDTTIAGNGGIGIYVDNETANVTVRNSTISNNGAGISFFKCIQCLIENVTISNNQRDGLEIGSTFGGVNNYDTTVNNSTIFNNGIVSGGSLFLFHENSTNRLILNNSILATNNNFVSNCRWTTGYSHVILATHSLMDDNSCSAIGTGNIIANPQLGPLTNNGGPTLTLLPLSGSPLIDAGDNGTCSNRDQRGLPRPIDKLGSGAVCDIGSTETQ